jgi:hypothetical protein
LVLGKWIEYDDDSPIAQREEDITKLSGGGKIAVYMDLYNKHHTLPYHTKCKQPKDTGNNPC